MHTSNKIAAILLTGTLLATSGYAQSVPELEKQKVDAQIQPLEKEKAERLTFLKSQEPVASLATASASADTAFATFRKTEKVAAIETARNKAHDEYNKALEEAKKTDTEYAALRAKEKEIGERLKASDITPEASEACKKELAEIRKQKEERKKALNELPAVTAAKTANDAAAKAFTDMSNEPEYAKLQKESTEARNAMNKALDDAKKADATYTELSTKIEELRRQSAAFAAQIQANAAKK